MSQQRKELILIEGSGTAMLGKDAKAEILAVRSAFRSLALCWRCWLPLRSTPSFTDHILGVVLALLAGAGFLCMAYRIPARA